MAQNHPPEMLYQLTLPSGAWENTYLQAPVPIDLLDKQGNPKTKWSQVLPLNSRLFIVNVGMKEIRFLSSDYSFPEWENILNESKTGATSPPGYQELV